MRYHDWHLSGYSVLDGGTRLVLHLLWNYPPQERLENHIQFAGVAAYHFNHTDGAILTDIEEEPIKEYFRREEAFIFRAMNQTGLRYCPHGLKAYEARLGAEGFKYWTLGSAIGFEGFVVAQAVAELPSPEASVK